MNRIHTYVYTYCRNAIRDPSLDICCFWKDINTFLRFIRSLSNIPTHYTYLYMDIICNQAFSLLEIYYRYGYMRKAKKILADDYEIYILYQEKK